MANPTKDHWLTSLLFPTAVTLLLVGYVHGISWLAGVL